MKVKFISTQVPPNDRSGKVLDVLKGKCVEVFGDGDE